MSITAQQCRAARVGIGKNGLSRKDLAAAAGVAERTLIDFERGARTPINATLEAIKRALEGYGVGFPAAHQIALPDPDAEPELPLDAKASAR